MVFIKFNLTYLLITHNVWPEGPETIDKLSLNYTIDMMMGELYVITFVTAIKITLDFLKEQRRVTDLEKSQLETELLFLKSQIHYYTAKVICRLKIDWLNSSIFLKTRPLLETKSRLKNLYGYAHK